MKPKLPENLSEVMAALGRRRVHLLGEDGRKKLASLGGRSSWANMNQAERIIEMKRRCRIRMKNKAKRTLAKLTTTSR